MNNIYFLNRTAEKFYHPKIEYTGKYEFIDEDFGNWKIRFLESGTLKFIENQPEYLDVFLVGGGASGCLGGNGTSTPGSGGAGGFTSRGIIKLNSQINEFKIEIGEGGTAVSAQGGSDGKPTKAFDLIAKGGIAGTDNNNFISEGGSGGGGYKVDNSASGENEVGCNGGSNGSNGDGETFVGKGQNFTTREFYESNGKLYAGGGGSASSKPNIEGGLGGAGGGGKGSNSGNTGATAGEPNTGGGGGGGNSAGAQAGGSGIVVIRNTRYN